MKAVALLPLLAALGQAMAATEHPHAEALARRINPRRHHAHEVERMIAGIKKREAAAEIEKKAVASPEKRLIRKKGQTCRPRNAASASALASSASASATSTAGGYLAIVAPSASATTTAGSSNGNGNAASPSAAATTSSAAPAASSQASTGGGSTSNGANSGALTPRNNKAGMTAGDSVPALKGLISWYTTWDAVDHWNNFDYVDFVPMLWGAGTTDSKDASRLADFKGITGNPQWILGMNEPDCAAGGDMSSGLSIAATAALWNQLMVPKGQGGSLLASPSMCKQKDENGWLKQFQGQISRDFDISSIHINKNNVAGIKADIDYYWTTYGKPIWVTEFACVDDANNFTPCTDQGQINQFISDAVDIFENDSRVYAYAYSNGNGLGNVWPSWSNGGLSASGQAYKAALQRYH